MLNQLFGVRLGVTALNLNNGSFKALDDKSD